MSFASAFTGLLPAFVIRRLTLGVTILAAAASLAQPRATLAAPGDADPNFLAAFTEATIFSVLPYEAPYIDPTDGLEKAVRYLVAGGDRETFGRLTPAQGVLVTTDPLLNFGAAGRIVYTVVADPADQNKFYAGGLFGRSGAQADANQAAANIFRFASIVLPDATGAVAATYGIDTTFNTGRGANDYVTAILPTAYPNGDTRKLVVGGLFTSFNRQERNHVVRLLNNSALYGVVDGTIDPNFNPALRVDDNVLSLDVQYTPGAAVPAVNGQVLVAGLFNGVNGTTATKLVRLNDDGSRDLSFNPNIDTRVNVVKGLPDGKILIGGLFTNVNGVAANRIARLNYDGSLDTTFNTSITLIPAENVDPVAVYSLLLQPDGRVYVGGNFIRVNGLERRYLAVLFPDGSVDVNFDPGFGILNAVQTISQDTRDNAVYIGQTFSRNGTAGQAIPRNILRIQGAGDTVNVAGFKNVREGNPANKRFRGKIRLTRAGVSTSAALTVSLQVGGTATAAQYTLKNVGAVNPGDVFSYTIPAGQSEAVIKAIPTGATVAAPQSLSLTVLSAQDGSRSYNVGGAAAAAISVVNP